MMSGDEEYGEFSGTVLDIVSLVNQCSMLPGAGTRPISAPSN